MLMYNMMEYSLNYSDTTGSLWFYFKGEADNFNANVAHTNDFKSFQYKTKLLGSTAAANRISENVQVIFGDHWKFHRFIAKQNKKLNGQKNCVLATGSNDKKILMQVL